MISPRREAKRRQRSIASPAPKSNAVAKRGGGQLPAVVEARPGNLLAAIVNAASDPRCDPQKMNLLLDVRDRLMRQEAHAMFTAAYVEMSAELPSINQDGMIEAEGVSRRSGKAYSQKTRYATYQNINQVTRPILARHKFAMMMLPDAPPDGGILMRGKLCFVCDTQYGKMVHEESCVVKAPLETSGSKNNVQGVGSSLSYTKRYAAVALLNLVSHAPEDKDDDGRRAGGGAPTLDDEQSAALSKSIEWCTIGEKRFCEKYKIEKVADLPAAMFNEAMKSCQDFHEKREAELAKRQQEAK